MARTYDDIDVGKDLRVIGEYSPTQEERKSLSKMDAMFQSAKKAKEHKIGRWRRN